MRRVFRLSIIFIISLLSVTELFAFSSKNVLNPVPGKWANVQPLVIKNLEECDIYYSLYSDNPLESGFIYDGPVVIDEIGHVVIHIVAIDKEGIQTAFTIEYDVDTSVPNDLDFIKTISLEPIRKYVSGTIFTIPNTLHYCFGAITEPYYQGTSLSISANNSFERYLPCTISDGSLQWRFVIHVVAAPRDLLTTNLNVPFEVTNWNKFLFTGNKLIYQIDNELWNANTEPVILDRSISHKISWQSIEYEFGNLIETVTLPPKPQLSIKESKNGSKIIYSESNNVLLGRGNKKAIVNIADNINDNSLIVDAFEGETIDDTVCVGVYYDNVYQGDIDVSILLDKEPPLKPFITSTSGKSYARNKVSLSISSEVDTLVYYSISEPVLSEKGFDGSEKTLFDSVESGEYKLYSGNPIILESKDRKAAFYKVTAYCLDLSGNKSQISEYRVIVDEYNYYLSTENNNRLNTESQNTLIPDGSYANPFTTFAQAVELINKSSGILLHVSGTVNLLKDNFVITSPCHIIGTETRIVFPPNATIEINSVFEASGCVFEKHVETYQSRSEINNLMQSEMDRLFIVKDGELRLTDCELIGVFSSNGILIDSTSSQINLNDCGLTISADSYSCIMSTINTNVILTNLRMTSTAKTSVCCSIDGGTFDLLQSNCKVIGSLCRIVELTKSKASIIDNTFTAKTDGQSLYVEPVWKDVNTIIEKRNNSSDGF